MAITTTVGTHERIMTVLETTRRFRTMKNAPGARVLGAHFYGPYFRYEARGAHPGAAGGGMQAGLHQRLAGLDRARHAFADAALRLQRDDRRFRRVAILVLEGGL